MKNFTLFFYFIRMVSIYCRIYHNDGRLEGWDEQFIEHWGSITEVNDTRFEGGTSIKFTQVCIHLICIPKLICRKYDL